MSLAARMLRLAGSTPVGLPVIRLIAALSRHDLLSSRSAARAVEELAAGAPENTIVVPLDLGGPPRVLVECDLSFAGCRDVLVTPLTRSTEWTSIRLFCALARDAMTIVDVGANVGLYTYAAAHYAPHATVRAYEPTPALAALIGRNIVRNAWTSRADARAEGVSASAGTMTFYVRTSDSESTFEPTRVVGTHLQRQITVPVVALDDVFDAEGIDPARALLKIDVEGHEMRVLDGLDRTLHRREGRPTLFMEFLGRAITEDRIIDRVLDLGFAVYYVARRSLVRLESTSDFQRAQDLDLWNFLVTDRSPEAIARVAAVLPIAIAT